MQKHPRGGCRGPVRLATTSRVLRPCPEPQPHLEVIWEGGGLKKYVTVRPHRRMMTSESQGAMHWYCSKLPGVPPSE